MNAITIDSVLQEEFGKFLLTFEATGWQLSSPVRGAGYEPSIQL
jgi:hypothetical protein